MSTVREVGASLCVFERTHSVVTVLGWFGLTARVVWPRGAGPGGIYLHPYRCGAAPQMGYLPLYRCGAAPQMGGTVNVRSCQLRTFSEPKVRREVRQIFVEIFVYSAAVPLRLLGTTICFLMGNII